METKRTRVGATTKSGVAGLDLVEAANRLELPGIGLRRIARAKRRKSTCSPAPRAAAQLGGGIGDEEDLGRVAPERGDDLGLL